MKIRVLGAGAYGCAIATELLSDGHEVQIHEIADRVFAGATGNIPARLHQGQHYSRSALTRQACQRHYEEFIARYGEFTRGIPVNLYAIAARDSLVDFGTYRKILTGEIEFITVERPHEFGLRNVEGALLTGERHILVDEWGQHFAEALGDFIEFNRVPGVLDDPEWDLTIDATFCALDNSGVDRFEACLTLLLQGPTERAVTICDGKFPSLYPWDELRELSSLTSAKWTPMKKCDTWAEAKHYLDTVRAADIEWQAGQMWGQMVNFYPRLQDEYEVAEPRMAIRAMPRSASDARLIDVIRVGERAIRIRAGKIDAIFEAARVIKGMLPEYER